MNLNILEVKNKIFINLFIFRNKINKKKYFFNLPIIEILLNKKIFLK